MTRCLMPGAIDNIKIAMDEYRDSIVRTLAENIDPGSRELYEDLLDSIDSTVASVDSASCFK
ncbi:MAG: hypothetical protein KAJ39_06280 [Gammaproteobacteria bacterium]|nr:hypothetical protein [Gammaproteobacteria bacterium]